MILQTHDGPLYVDFVEYVHTRETFADREYKKWLAERDRLKREEALRNKDKEEFSCK